MVLVRLIYRNEEEQDIDIYVLAESVCAACEPYGASLRAMNVVAEGDNVVYVEPEV